MCKSNEQPAPTVRVAMEVLAGVQLFLPQAIVDLSDFRPFSLRDLTRI
jgi:hypothetical protein